MSVQEAVDQIIGKGDGPITPFVIISRGFDLFEAGHCSKETAANAVYVALQARRVEFSPDMEAE